MSKKKKPTTKVSAEPVEQIDPTPVEGVRSVQLDEALIEEKTEHAPTEAETTQKAEPEKSAHAETAPAEETVSSEPPHVPVLGPKPKNLTMAYLQEEIDYLTYQIGELLKNPVWQRKPPASNGKIMIKDTLTGKIYPSKNNVYQSLLKAGELDDLVKKGVFGVDPAHNSFGCYNLFRFYKERFIELTHEETNVT